MELRWMQNEADVRSASFLHARGWQAGFRGIFSEGLLSQIPDDFFEDTLGRHLQTQRFHTAILSHEGKDLGAGTCGLSRDWEDPSLGEIASLYFLPEAWGQGYAVPMMDFMLARLREIGCAKAHLWVLTKNFRAQRFYEKYGFRSTGDEKPITLRDETQMNMGYEIELG